MIFLLPHPKNIAVVWGCLSTSRKLRNSSHLFQGCSARKEKRPKTCFYVPTAVNGWNLVFMFFFFNIFISLSSSLGKKEHISMSFEWSVFNKVSAPASCYASCFFSRPEEKIGKVGKMWNLATVFLLYTTGFVMENIKLTKPFFPEPYMYSHTWADF